MDLALVTIAAGLLMAGPWLEASYPWAASLWAKLHGVSGLLGVALIVYATFHLVLYSGAIASAFGYVPMLAFACSLGLVFDLIIGVRFALPLVRSWLARRAPTSSRTEQLLESLDSALGTLRQREAMLSCSALGLGLLSLVSMVTTA